MTREEAIDKLHGLIYGVVDRQRIDDTCREVIDYLNEQEPRVMTLEEVKAKPDYAWIEKLDSKKTYIVLFDFTAVLSDLSSYAHVRNHYGEDELLLLLLYNKTWRCWTSRPDQATREATSWN